MGTTLKRIFQFIKTHRLFVFFTLFYLTFSFLTYKDYGITFDEKVEYDAGAYLAKYYTTPTSQKYLFEMINDGPVHIETRHLPLFTVYSRIYVMLLTLLNFKFYYEWFHLLNLLFGYLLFYFSYVFFFSSGYRPSKAIFAPVLLFLTPYVLGHIPGNPKDIPFAWAYLGSLFFIHLFSSRKTDFRIKVLVLGVIFGISYALRAVGLTLLIISFIYEIFFLKKSFWPSVIDHMLITLISLFIWILSMPWLGANFFINFIGAVFNAKAYSDWNGTLFYLGKFINKYQIPWHYLFVLLGVKIPIPFVIFAFIGFYKLFISTVKKSKITSLTWLLLTSILLNTAIYIITSPVVYNGIRHFLYLVVLVVLFSISYLLSIKNKYLVILVAAYFVFTVIRMVMLHPFEYVYFNELTWGLRGAKNYFQLDYWGASYKEARSML